MWEWTVKKAERRRIDAFELWCWRRLLRVPWTARRSNPVHSEGDQPWDFFGKNDAKAETPVLWPPHAKSWLIGKDSDAGRDWGQEEKGTTEDEMAGWHHWLDVCESEWTPGVGDGQGGLACCDSWGHRVGHEWATELNWTELIFKPWLWFVLPDYHCSNLDSHIFINGSSFLLFLSFFKKYKFIYFNWRLITLQYCIGFAIHQHESATGIHLFLFLSLVTSSWSVFSVFSDIF